MFKNKKAVSPLVATVILVLFSLLLGTVTMNLGKTYIEGIAKTEAPKVESFAQMQKYIGSSLYECTEIDIQTKECIRWELVQ